MAKATDRNTMISSRRTVLAGVPAAAAAALAVGAAVNGLATAVAASSAPDPIFAVIAEHKAAGAARTAALLVTFGLSGCLHPNEPEDSPANIAADEAHDEAFDREFAALDELLTTIPTTIAGVAALLAHYAASHYYPDGHGQSLLSFACENQGIERGDVDDQMLAIAAVLRGLADRGMQS
jgi:hypothetical protein